MTTNTKTEIKTLRRANRPEDNDLGVGTLLYKEQVAGYFDEYVVVQREEKERLQPAAKETDPKRRTVHTSIRGTYSHVDTGSYVEYLDDVPQGSLFGGYFVETDPGDPGAIEGQIFLPSKALLTLRVEFPIKDENTDLDAILQQAIDILLTHGFQRRLGCSVTSETDKRVHLFQGLGDNAVLVAANVPSSDSTYIASKYGMSAYGSQIADPRMETF